MADNPITDIIQTAFNFALKEYTLDYKELNDKTITNNSPFVHNKTNFTFKKTLYFAENEIEQVFLV